ncbi:hypothetical protein KFU94_35015 [Chloroflexi bacterium TSY]|nr:hypothetical protein [Chloroflexi bacterium TSY]
MRLTLASTWTPRGERVRLQKLYSQLKQLYDTMVVSVPKTIEQEDRMLLQEELGIGIVVMPQRGWGRYLVMHEALKSGADFIHYCDFDRLLHWVEADPSEWQTTVQRIRQTDCLIMGRSEQALHSHPQALVQTERIINTIASSILTQSVDLGGGSRGLSRAAAQFLIEHTTPGSWGDAQWPILLHRAGFRVDYVALDGLEWESPDRYRNQAATSGQRSQAAETYDQDAKHWARRVQIAQEIIQEGLVATHHLSSDFSETQSPAPRHG